MPKNQNLIDLTNNSAKAREMGKKGGSVKSPRKKLAAKLRELKKKGLTNEMAKHLSEVMEDPSMCALDIYNYIGKIRETVGDKPYQMIQIGKLYVDWHKMHHGEKVKMESRNVNLNIDVNEETANKILNGVFNNYVKE